MVQYNWSSLVYQFSIYSILIQSARSEYININNEYKKYK